MPSISKIPLRRGYPLELLLNSTARHRVAMCCDRKGKHVESIGAAVLSITEALGQLATGLASQGLREKGRSQAMLVGGSD